MPRARLMAALLAGAGTLMLAGCLTAPTVPNASWLDRFRAGGPQGEDVIAIDFALLEAPAGDRFLDRELWASLDEQSVDVERRPALDENGFRVGLVGGIPPAGLQSLLTSERACLNPHQVRMKAGQSKGVQLGTPRPQLQFDAFTDGKPQAVKLEAAQCQLGVVPTLLPDGRVKLQFTPQVLHGGRSLMPTVADGNTWSVGGKATERYPAMGWEITLALQEYLVVGTRIERAGTLGHQCFALVNGDAPPTQRVLVVRAGRGGAAPSDLPPLDTPDGATASLKVPPLAAQASRVARGSGE